MEKKEALKNEVLEQLKLVYDPEIPVNIYDLGLIYKIDIEDNLTVNIEMTLTAPNCPMVDQLMADINSKLSNLKDATEVNINITFDPPWDKSMLSEEAKLELGFL